jgi:hypothetical protein
VVYTWNIPDINLELEQLGLGKNTSMSGIVFSVYHETYTENTNNSHCRALRRRGGAIGRSSIVATLEGKSLCITPFGLYPASRISGRGPAGLGKPKLLLPTGQTQAHGWGVRALKVKIVVGGGRRSIWALEELWPGEMNACVKEGVGW